MGLVIDQVLRQMRRLKRGGSLGICARCGRVVTLHEPAVIHRGFAYHGACALLSRTERPSDGAR